jgi:hypothetical protein
MTKIYCDKCEGLFPVEEFTKPLDTIPVGPNNPWIHEPCGEKIPFRLVILYDDDSIAFSRDEAIDVIYGENAQFKVIKDIITDQGRWSTYHSVIIQDKITGFFYKSYYSRGSTESQDVSAYEYDDPVFMRVYQVPVTHTEYLTKDELDAKQTQENDAMLGSL